MFSYRTLAVSVLPRDPHGGQGPVAALDLPPEVGHRGAGNVARAFFGEDFCDEPTCFNDTCFGDTCPDPTCFEDTCLHHSCHHQTCPEATALPPACEGLSCDGASCDANTCADSCEGLSCDDKSCFPAGGSCPADSCLDGQSIPECQGDGSGCGPTVDCDDDTCQQNSECQEGSDCFNTIPAKVDGKSGELAQLHRELDGLQEAGPYQGG